LPGDSGKRAGAPLGDANEKAGRRATAYATVYVRKTLDWSESDGDQTTRTSSSEAITSPSSQVPKANVTPPSLAQFVAAGGGSALSLELSVTVNVSLDAS